MAQAETPSRPAEPILASALLDDGDLEGLIDGLLDGKVVGEGRKDVVGTGIKSVDDALGGGLRGGRVVGVSGEVGSGVVDLYLSFLTTSLLSKSTCTAAIIDATGNFDVLRIYSLIVTRLRQDEHLMRSQQATTNSKDLGVEDVAAKILDRVKIMRVFDFVGVMEAVSEIREGLERKEKEKVVLEEKKEVVGRVPLRKAVIADSEDEEEEDEEMLFDVPVTDSQPAVPPREAQPEPERSKPEEDTVGRGEKTSIILIDNLARVINPLLRKDYVHANALSSTFLHTLSHLTHTHTLLTLLYNPASNLRPLASPPTSTSNTHQGPQPPQPQQQPPPPSIFSSICSVPSLNNLLPAHLDMHLLVSKLSQRKLDARPVYTGNGGLRERRGIDMASVVEVVADRWCGRVGCWGNFVEGREGEEGY